MRPRLSRRTLLLPLVAIAICAATSLHAQIAPVATAATAGPAVPTASVGATGRIAGTAVDPSSGVLPGVTVTAMSADGRTLAMTATNATGEFSFQDLPVGRVDLVFGLGGFAPSRLTVTVEGFGSTVPDQRLVHRMDLQALTESVVVRGDPPPPPPPPRPVLAPVPEHDPASVCGPAMVEAGEPSFGTIRSRRDDEVKALFAAGDELLIDGGTRQGLETGRHFIVRRAYPTALRTGRNRGLVVMGEHSSGLLQVVKVEADVSTAVVVYACDEMMPGDYLTAFEPEPAGVPDLMGTPVFDRATKVLFADAGQTLGIPGRMMVIDRARGSELRPGQRLTLFRRSRHKDARPHVVGEAVVVAVRTYSATIRVESATDVIFFGESGDWAAPQSPASQASN